MNTRLGARQDGRGELALCKALALDASSCTFRSDTRSSRLERNNSRRFARQTVQPLGMALHIIYIHTFFFVGFMLLQQHCVACQ